MQGRRINASLDEVDPDPASVTELLEGIPGLFERVQLAESQLERGEITDLDEL